MISMSTAIDHTAATVAPAICAGLADGDVNRIASLARKQQICAKSALFFEMDPARYVYEVVEGILRLSRTTYDGRRQIIDFVVPGRFLGLTQHGCHVSTAEAITDVTVWCYPTERLEELLDEVPALSRRLLGIAQEELLETQKRLVWLGRKDTIERVCSFLLQLAEQLESTGSDAEILHIPMTRSEIADYLGLTTETVSRTFTRLREMGVIRSQKMGRLVECDFDALRRLADADDDPTVH